MDEVIRVLWEYASTYRLEGCYGMGAQEGRKECANLLVRNREELGKICPSDVSRRIDALCDGWEELRGWDMEAAFACGFRLGMSLR